MVRTLFVAGLVGFLAAACTDSGSSDGGGGGSGSSGGSSSSGKVSSSGGASSWGGSSSGVGETCGTTPDGGTATCALGLACCYPCGVPGCTWQCEIPCDGGQACMNGCELRP